MSGIGLELIGQVWALSVSEPAMLFALGIGYGLLFLSGCMLAGGCRWLAALLLALGAAVGAVPFLIG